ncbi:MAG: TIGR00180 family glycosyltransferase [Candidatus Omnitrophica bacterium]|nr:TIGR00180 family glycosyltransferase [Candidatus Omnitrophota bacterium]
MSRLLTYYSQTKYPYKIVVLDSSTQHHLETNAETIQAFKGHLEINHHALPGLSCSATLDYIRPSISTPYCASVSDDDFLTTGGLLQCMTFLENNTDYTAAHGVGSIFALDRSGPYGEMIVLKRYPQSVLEAKRGYERLGQYLKPPGPYAIFFSLFRTEAWRAAFRGISTLAGINSSNVFKDELIPGCVSAIRGRVKEIPVLSLVRQGHDARYHQPDPYDWITHANWFPSFQMYRDRMLEELTGMDGLARDEAEQFIKQFFARHLASKFAGSLREDGVPRRRRADSRIRRFVRGIPFLKRTWFRWEAMIRGSGSGISLKALLKTSSPYHEEFMPVYRVVTKTARQAGGAGRPSAQDLATVNR